MSTENIFLLETHVGFRFETTAAKAIELAKEKGLVRFDFNGITCTVNENTNPDWLLRDYYNAFTLKESSIGPETVEIYDAEFADRLQKAEAMRDKAWEESLQAEKEKNAAERAAFEAKTTGITFSITNQSFWDKQKEVNTDDYGGCVLNYAEAWARLMQAEMAQGHPLEEIASTTSHELGYFGISGFMYGAAVSVLSECWEHGQQLRDWHNTKYGYTGGDTANPALVTLNTTENV